MYSADPNVLTLPRGNTIAVQEFGHMTVSYYRVETAYYRMEMIFMSYFLLYRSSVVDILNVLPVCPVYNFEDLCWGDSAVGAHSLGVTLSITELTSSNFEHLSTVLIILDLLILHMNTEALADVSNLNSGWLSHSFWLCPKHQRHILGKWEMTTSYRSMLLCSNSWYICQINWLTLNYFATISMELLSRPSNRPIQHEQNLLWFPFGGVQLLKVGECMRSGMSSTRAPSVRLAAPNWKERR